MFQRFQTWAKKVWRIASSPAEYRALRSLSLSHAIKYLYVLLLALSFLFTLKIIVAFLVARPAIGHFMEEVKREVPALYPEELVLTLFEGRLSTNVEEPYVIELPASWKPDRSAHPDFPAHLLTIDTHAPIDDFEKYDSFALATETALVVHDRDEGGYRVIKLDRFDDAEEGKSLIIDQATYLTIVGKGFRVLQYLPLLLGILAIFVFLLFPFLVAGSLLAWMLFYLLFATVFTWIPARIMGVRLHYGERYRLGVFALTLPILVSIPLYVLGLTLPLAFTLVFFIFMTFIFREFRSSDSSVVSSVEQ